MMIGLCLASLSVIAASITVKSDRNPVSLNDSFQLVYESAESVDDDPDFSPLLQHLDILNRSQSSNTKIMNGQYSHSKSWTLTAMAKKAGLINLPPISFGSDRSEPYSLQVRAAVDNPQKSMDFFSRIKLSHNRVYVQQQLVVTQQLFSAKNLAQTELGDLTFSGMDVLVEPLGEEKNYQTRIANRAYLVVERNFAVYAQKNGTLKLGPALVQARLSTSSSSFFTPFSGSGKIVRARSQPQSIEVLGVPAEANMNPWLPASSIQLLEQWPEDPPQFIRGEPVTRTLSLKAEGLTSAQLPEMPTVSTKGLKHYPDQPLLNDIKNDTGITGYRLEKVALIPTQSGEYRLPAIDIPWWNIETNSREVAHIPARTIRVAPSPTAMAVPPAGAVTKAPTSAAIKNEEVGETLSEADSVSARWMILAGVFLFAWLLTIALWLYSARKKTHQPEKSQPTPSIEKNYKRLVEACKNHAAAECRRQLLIWAQDLYGRESLTQLSQLSVHVSKEMAEEIKKLDAYLYAEHNPEINFRLIAEQAGRLMAKKGGKLSVEILEPLYR